MRDEDFFPEGWQDVIEHEEERGLLND